MGEENKCNLEVNYMGYIYLITNKINNKKYVGQTINSINTRWIQHKCEAKYLRPDVYFIRALRKYGTDNFIVEQLEECDNSLLDEREQYYIKLYNSNNKEYGYNSTIGGNSNNRKYEREDILNLWDEGLTIKEIAQQLLCCYQTVSTVLSDNGINESLRRSRSMQKASEAKKKPILQYSLDGQLVNRFSCINDAIQKTGFHETSIRDVCNHRRHSANGYIWCHEDEPKSIQQLIAEIPLEKTKRPIEQYTLEGILINKYNSIAEAAQLLNIHRSSIEDALSNKSFNCQGYLWKYQDDNEDILVKVERNNNKKDYAKIAVNQYDLEGNLLATYKSAAEAAIAIGKPGNGSSITKACKGKLKSAYKYKWAYAEA